MAGGGRSSGATGTRRRWVVVVLAVLVVAAVVVALLVAGDGDDGDGPGGGDEAGRVRAPLTGLLVEAPLRPALVVKIDNVDAARPQSGLGAADVIVETMVEGGLTRLAAIYSSTDPGTVGPVRSVRPTDLELAALLGRPVIAFSGGALAVLDEVDRAEDEGSLVAVSEATDPDAFRRSDDREAPHNLYADAGALWAAGPEAEVPAALFAYGEEAEPGSGTVAFSVAFPSVGVAYRWDAERGLWLRSQDGTPMVLAESDAQLGVENVVVLRVEHEPAPHDERSPVADLASGGDAWVFRDGGMTACRWSTSESVTPRIDLRAADGTACTLRPGRTILELAPAAPTTEG